MKILVLGASGMLGNAVFRVLSENRDWAVFGTTRSETIGKLFVRRLAERLVPVGDLEDHGELVRLFDTVQPQVVVNCTALPKAQPQDPLKSISIYSLLPQRLAHLCRLGDARLVQISSDGVFSGARGAYTEDDCADAVDLYGISKILGEVREKQAITLRTSIIGHELQTGNGLLEWFLSQEGHCKCFTHAIFSGFPTVVLGQIIRDRVIPRPDLFGIYHVASSPISKFDLLTLVSERYDKSITIAKDDTVVIDRSLIGDRFNAATGYVPPDWPELVRTMHSYQFGLARE